MTATLVSWCNILHKHICQGTSHAIYIRYLSQQILLFQSESQFADDNFNFGLNGITFSKLVENTVGKGEIACYEQCLLFPVFSKDLYCTHVKPLTLCRTILTMNDPG